MYISEKLLFRFPWSFLKNNNSLFCRYPNLNYCRRPICYLKVNCPNEVNILQSATSSGFKTSYVSSLFSQNHSSVNIHTTCMKKKEISFEEYEKIRNKITVIDVRNNSEIKSSGSIPGSLIIPLDKLFGALNQSAKDFKANYGRTKPSKNEMVLFVCQRGVRSKQAMQAASKLGYNKYVDFSKFEMRKFFSKKIMPSVEEEFRHLDYTQLNDITMKGNSIVIDVREKSELEETGTIPGSHHIPLGEVERALLTPADDFEKLYNFKKPNPDDSLVFSCRSGKRSLVALEKALAHGFTNAKHYSGGWLDWERKSSEPK